MKRRFSAFLLATLMLAALLPMTSMATDMNAEDFLGLAVDDVIKLTGDVKLTQLVNFTSDMEITADSPVTIDASAVHDAIAVDNGATLTLGENITIESDEAVLWVKSGGKLIIDGAVVNSSSNTDDTACPAYVAAGGTIEVKAGALNGTGAQTTLSVKGTAIISGTGKVTSTKCSAVVAKGSGTVTVSGGTVETTCLDPAFVALYSFSGTTVAVSGGTVKAAAGYAIAPEKDQTGIVDITISDGTIIGGTGAAWNVEGNTGFVISGGTFSHAPAGVENADGYSIIPPPVYGGPVMNWVKVNAAENGVVKSGPLAASEGATITLYPKASAGYVLDTVEVLDAAGNAVQLDGMKFQVPLGGVTVNATFKAAE